MGWFKREDKWESPVGDPENLDILTKRPDGFLDLLIVVARPLDLSARSVQAVSQKFRNYCLYVKSPAFSQEFGPPDKLPIRLGLVSDWDIPPDVVGLIEQIAEEERVPAELAIFYEYPPRSGVQAANLFPYVVPRSYFEVPEPAFAQQVQEGFVRPIAHDLHRMLVHSADGVIRNVQPEDLAELKLDIAAAEKKALENLVALANGTSLTKQLEETPTGIPYLLWMGHWLTASCIQLPELHSWARMHLKTDDILVSIPQTELMFLFPHGDAGFRDMMKQFIRKAVAGMDKLVTFNWFSLSRNGVAPNAQ
jgi:hypothetical protein